MILVVVLKIAIIFIVLGIIEEGNPLLVLVVLDHRVTEEVLLQRDANRAEELLVIQILHDNADDLLRLGVAQRHHDSVRVLQIRTIYEFHVPVGVETNFIFVFSIIDTRLEVDVIYTHVQLEAEAELCTS